MKTLIDFFFLAIPDMKQPCGMLLIESKLSKGVGTLKQNVI